MIYLKSLVKSILNKALSKFGHEIVHSEYLVQLKKNTIIEEINDEQKKLLHNALKFSGVGIIPTWMLINSIKYIYDNKIEGDFVEAGVWQGGNLIIFKELIEKYDLNKKIYGYDTFEGMPEPTAVDVKWNNVSATDRAKLKGNDWCKCSIEDVKKNLLTSLKNLKGISLIKGLVEDTLLVEDNLPKKISLLRLDTDFYESTKVELEILFPRLAKGGILIIDDYGNWKGAKKAVDEYFNERAFLIYLDHGVRMYINR
mgnify:CR=1 FL=1|tara:strand:+ start:560 stop:1327 length:768 start_codon:yes stop_codon:yes gene_type:complete